MNATGAWGDRLRGEVGGAAADPPAPREPPPLPAVAVSGGSGGHVPPPARRTASLRLPVGGPDAPRHDRLRPPRVSRRGALDRPRRDLLPRRGGAGGRFPPSRSRRRDAVSSFAGVRPVVGTGRAKPSEESRDHVLWEEAGLADRDRWEADDVPPDRARRAEAPSPAPPGTLPARRLRVRLLPCRSAGCQRLPASTRARLAASPGGTGPPRPPSSPRRDPGSSRRCPATALPLGRGPAGRRVPRGSCGSTTSS